jgi:hypothetical protein
MKKISALLLLLLFSSIPAVWASTGTEQFQKLESDPRYVEVQKLCVAGDPISSLVRLQKEFIIDADTGAKVGLESSIGKNNPIKVDDFVKKQWESDPFFLGLIDCFGNTKEGVLLTKAFMSELVLGYSTSQALGFGLPQIVAMRGLAAIWEVSMLGLKTALSQIEGLTELLETYPELLPRLRVFFKWGTRVGMAAYAVPQGVQSYRAQKKAMNEQMQKEDSQKIDVSSFESPDERAFEVEHEKTLIEEKKEQLKSCASAQSCQKIQAMISELEKDEAN